MAKAMFMFCLPIIFMAIGGLLVAIDLWKENRK